MLSKGLDNETRAKILHANNARVIALVGQQVRVVFERTEIEVDVIVGKLKGIGGHLSIETMRLRLIDGLGQAKQVYLTDIIGIKPMPEPEKKRPARAAP